MASSSNEANQELSRNALIALVIGSMVGSGIFALPAAFGRATGAFGAIIAWIIAGTGMLMLALVFQSLSQRKPELDAGIYAYAKAGFGDYIGFASAAGYWIGCCLADVACLILIKATLGQFFPIFGDGTTPTAIASATLLLWSVHFLVLRGIRGAARLNTIATFAKIVPILLFIVVAAFVLDRDLLVQNFWGTEPPNLQQVLSQVRSTMLLTVFVFVGVEGASVYSRYARNRADIGIATVVGFLSVLCLLVLVTLLSYGVLPRSELADLSTPSMAGVMESMVGRWGSVFISLALLISILGNYLSWSLLAAEILHSAAMHHTMPSFLARENANKVPVGALWLTNCVIQAFLLVSWFAEYAFTLALKMTSAMTLIPYVLVAAYGLKLASTGETYYAGERARTTDWIRAAVATLYAAAMIYAGGPKFLLLSSILYAPGTLLFLMAKRERKESTFTRTEAILFAAVAIAAAGGVYGLAVGAISI
ncbi:MULTISPECIES: basic amino acid/polyamine antiporter [Bradyrhizobium]|uniref:Amino acid permease n=1 Tax=Bradyrhizobium ottawaense TaxID=931866 RepID=A0A2U8PA42_9BRAD|nr:MULTISPECIES: basic amino acid/polyamine antiporter [Bradyrhizobium]AWL94641.1 amino acid permease [Bradyrhizobium ottawaense]MDA9445583.1 amino acid APC transporter [Bradyrhizobium sp. CCBAU 21360]MDA9459172.1 amino acid APC transporter [Bradyrhizobium sp. CCBAU 21359]MDA9511490.1 amino acid APC transporter [Bradyrhizobium sp. CCBAU 11430]